jgi:GNAT superfamily N-acetyltransferase
VTATATVAPSLLRGPRRADQSFIAATWVKQMASHDRRQAVGPRYGKLGRAVDLVLDRSDTRALVRHRAGDPDGILGWVVYVEGAGVPLVHFAYVRKEHRGQGYGAELLRAVGIEPTTACVYTCIGPTTSRLLHRYRAANYLPLEDFLG